MSNNFPLPYGLSLALPPLLTPNNRNDLLDFQGTNTVQGSRYINPQTQDFEQSANGLFQGMNAVDQQVQLALSTTFNSSAVLNFGQNFASIKVITPYISRQMISLLNNCLNNLIVSGSITITSAPIVSSSNQFGQVSLSFNYSNNTANTSTAVSYILPTT